MVDFSNPRASFDQDLELLSQMLQDLSEEAVQAYGKIKVALTEKQKDLALDVIRHDDVINELTEEINDMAILLIARQTPVASDLRRIIATLRMSSHLERVADYAVNLAEYILLNAEKDLETYTVTIVEMIDHLLKMIVKVMEAFHAQDAKQARQVAELDRILDAMYTKNLNELFEVTRSETANTAVLATQTILILKYLERAGDHVTNIAEEVAYLVKGKTYEFNKSSVKMRYLKDNE
ncbi:MAG: phosphate signaling complex protein PhoU [Culicoidibacterales bacterium]